MTLIQFVREFMMNPTAIGAIAPSSRFLAKEMIRGLDLARATACLEYGPGTGAFTGHILSAIPPSCKFVAIEKNPQFAQALRMRFPDLPIHEGSVADVRMVCDEHKIGMADFIVSSLPWATFTDDVQRTLLDAMMLVLKRGGQFVTFSYRHSQMLPAAKDFAGKLPNYFSKVTRSRTVWANLPPAFVYHCHL